MARRSRASLLLLPVVVPLALLVLADPAAASMKDDPQVVFTGQVVVPQGQTVGDVVIFNGDTTVDGTVRGSVTSFHGDVSISGAVTGSVTSFNGSVDVADTAHIGGDLSTRSRPSVAAGATIDGSRKRIPVQQIVGNVGWISSIAVWIAISVSTFVFGVLLLWFAPRAAEAVALAGLQRVGASIGWGFALFLGIPILAVISLVTIVGIPLGVGTLLGLALIYTLGYTSASFWLGRVLVKPPANRFLAFLVGWAILRVASIIPFVGGLVWLAATVFGLGMLGVAARRAARPQPAAPPPMPGTPVPAG
jgi:cytoskeletal protein CcmA (bactofilin family)